KKPVGRYNQWGGTAGGPFWVPKVFNGKNKVFWFFAMEEINDNFPEPSLVTVPTQAERGGNFAGLPTIYDPSTAVLANGTVTRTAFAGNQVPANKIGTIAKNYLNFYPLPNQPGNADGTSNYLTAQTRSDTYNSEMGRLDFNLGSRNKMF